MALIVIFVSPQSLFLWTVALNLYVPVGRRFSFLPSIRSSCCSMRPSFLNSSIWCLKIFFHVLLLSVFDRRSRIMLSWSNMLAKISSTLELALSLFSNSASIFSVSRPFSACDILHSVLWEISCSTALMAGPSMRLPKAKIIASTAVRLLFDTFV